MSKRTFIIFIVALVAILVGIGWYFFNKYDTEPIPVDTTATDSQNSDLFPFGERPKETSTGGLVPSTGENNQVIDLATTTEESVMPRFRQISSVPTAGAVAFDVGTTTTFRYIERATGHIDEITDKTSEPREISNTTIPKVYEGLWSNDGTKVIVRYVKDDSSRIRSFYVRIATTTRPEQAIEGIFLPDDIREVTVTGTKSFYMTESAGGSSGVLSNMDGSGKSSVFSSSFSDWRYSFASPSLITLFTRPSGLSDGTTYILNASSGSYTKVASGRGLVGNANTDGSQVLVSTSNNRSLNTVAIDMRTKTSSSVGVTTLADKCVWSAKNKNLVYCAVPKVLPSAVYPDDWYKGKLSFEDSLWSIDVVSGDTEDILDPELESGVSMDMIKLSLDKEERYILFTNKKDMTVWAYKLGE